MKPGHTTGRERRKTLRERIADCRRGARRYLENSPWCARLRKWFAVGWGAVCLWLDKILRRMYLREGLAAWRGAARLYLENRARRAEADALDRRRQDVCLEIGTREEDRLGSTAPAERQRVEQARATCRAAEERHAAARAALAEAARQTAAGQGRCQQNLADEYERFRRAMQQVRDNRQDSAARLAVEDAVRRIKQLRWAWQAEYAQSRNVGLQLGRDSEQAERGVSERTAELDRALRELGLALFLAGGVEESLAARLQTLQAEWIRLVQDMKGASETMRRLVKTGRRPALVLAVILALLCGGTLAYRIWHRANLKEQSQKISRDLGRQDRDKSATEQKADNELEADYLSIVE